MGRHMAGESFLRAWLAYGQQSPWSFQLAEAEHCRPLEQQLSAWLPSETRVEIHQSQSPQSLSRTGALFRPGPGLASEAKARSWLGSHHHSLCGITHTLSSQLAMDEVQAMVGADVQPWDALICTSQAARTVVETLFEQEEEHLKARLGATHFTRPQLPTIPLGVHTRDFQFSLQDRIESRNALGLAQTDIAVLFAGRLSFHAKAHPLVLYQALHRAQSHLAQTGSQKRLVLLEFGQFPNQAIANAFQAAAQMVAPGLQVIHLDGKLHSAWVQAWSGADIFCSLSDNIQETFGITPVEAMAAGLPVIASDWNGYKDTVVHNEVGFRIPTFTPQPGLGLDLANRYAWGQDTYDYYCGHVASFTALDPQSLAQALFALAENDSRRTAMATAARLRAQSTYDWSVVIPQYLDLFKALAERRGHASTIDSTQAARRASMRHSASDPFSLFGGYPTSAWGLDTVIEAGPEPLSALAPLRELAMVSFARGVLPSAEEATELLERVSRGAIRIEALLQDYPQPHQAKHMRTLLWLAKLGLISRSRADR